MFPNSKTKEIIEKFMNTVWGTENENRSSRGLDCMKDEQRTSHECRSKEKSVIFMYINKKIKSL